MRHWPESSFTVAHPWRTIQLSDIYDIFCLVDAQDYEWLSANTWNFIWHGNPSRPLYARRNVGKERVTVYMAREVMTHTQPRSKRYMDGHLVDHINGNTLDNRRCNLRWATHKRNSLNTHWPSDVPSLASIMTSFPLPVFDIPF